MWIALVPPLGSGAPPGREDPPNVTRIHPRHDLDELIHAPVRPSAMAALAAVDSVDFGTLRDLVEASDSLLSKHLAVLEQTGYLRALPSITGGNSAAEEPRLSSERSGRA